MTRRGRDRRHNPRTIIMNIDLFWEIFWPFYKSGRGQIFAPASWDKRVRDGLALSQIARLFPLVEFAGIVVELSGPARIGPSIIVIGAAEMLVNWDSRRYRGPEVRPVGRLLGRRLQKLADLWCYRFSTAEPWAITNSVTGQTYESSRSGKDEDELVVDWGVIRIAYRGPFDNTLIFEGIHGVGTLGTCLTVCTPDILRPVVEALRELKQIDGYSEALPIEILVKTTYRPGLDGGRLTVPAVTPIPCQIVYNHDWRFDLRGARRWVDQTPPSHTIVARPDGSVAVSRGACSSSSSIMPRLEIDLDLRSQPAALRARVAGLFESCDGAASSAGPPDTAAVEDLLSAVRSHTDQVRLELFEATKKGGSPHSHVISAKATGYKRIQLTYLIESLFGHLFDRPYPSDAKSLRANLSDLIPRCRHPVDDSRIESTFVAQVAGKLKQSYPRLFRLDDGYTDKSYLALRADRLQRAYHLKLLQLTLVFKIRL